MWKIQLITKQEISELQCQWNKLPKIPIEKFHYVLPNKKTLLLEGFESYLCFKEIYKFVMKAKSSFTDTINIFAKYNNEVCQISYNPIKGKILQRKNVWGKEFTPLVWNTVTNDWGIGVARSTNRNLWQGGMKLEKASIKLV